MEFVWMVRQPDNFTQVLFVYQERNDDMLMLVLLKYRNSNQTDSSWNCSPLSSSTQTKSSTKIVRNVISFCMLPAIRSIQNSFECWIFGKWFILNYDYVFHNLWIDSEMMNLILNFVCYISTNFELKSTLICFPFTRSAWKSLAECCITMERAKSGYQWNDVRVFGGYWII